MSWCSIYSWLSQSLYRFSSHADLVILRWAYKHVREIARRMEFYRGDLQLGHPTFAEGSQAVTQLAGVPAEISTSKIIYSQEDDHAIDEFHRHTGSYNVNLQFKIKSIFFPYSGIDGASCTQTPSLLESFHSLLSIFSRLGLVR